MATTLTEQVRPWPPSASPGSDRIADDGAPLHSLFAYDLPRALNNLATLCEPGAGFAYSASEFLPYGGHPNPWYYRNTSAFPASGDAFLFQVPVLIKPRAKRLIWTLSLTRGTTIPEGSPTISLSSVKLYMAANPLTRPATALLYPTGTAGHEHETISTFTETNVASDSGGAYVARTFAVSFSGAALHVLAEDVTTGLTGFDDKPIADTSGGHPVAWLIIGAAFSGAAVGDSLKAQEFSWWFGF